MQIHPDTKAFLISNDWPGIAFGALLFLAGAYAALQVGDVWLAAGIWALAGILTIAIMAHAHLHSATTWLDFSEDKIVFQTGIFTHYKKMVPVGQITDTSTYASILDRLLGVSALRVSTGGRTGYEIDARNFRRDEADSVHHEIYELIKKHHAKKGEPRHEATPLGGPQAPLAHTGANQLAEGSAAAREFLSHHSPYGAHGANEKKDAKK